MERQDSTFRGDPELKERLLRGLAAHAAADRLHGGTYGILQTYHNGQRRWMACAIGCAAETLGIIPSMQTVRGSMIETGRLHEELEKALGVPEMALWLYDTIFEAVPSSGDEISWSREFIDAIPVGADPRKVALTVEAWVQKEAGVSWTERVDDGVVGLGEDDDDELTLDGMDALVQKRHELLARLLKLPVEV